MTYTAIFVTRKEIFSMQLSHAIDEIVRRSFAEDIGSGDITTELLIPPDRICSAEIYAKADGVVAGLEIPVAIFTILDREMEWTAHCKDGDAVKKGQTLLSFRGKAQAVLTGERTSLNFLQHLSGIATITNSIVSMLKESTITLLDTRKTVPGMRLLEKYAVAAGGGKNHRMGLFDGILIKNNHLKFNPLKEAVTRAKTAAPPHIKVEVEVESLAQVEEALAAGADIIMLDNMDIPLMKKALELINGRAKVEVSGNVTEETIPALIALPVDYISMGRLTHSAKALDISLRITAIEEPE
ncbi:MAG: carboxylating nicotinate-nucleotide diphosphorylase [Candidatus Xenobiia bacterium LiM19]